MQLKMSEMQGCQLKQIKRSPALRSKHTWCTHTLITPRHAAHTEMHKAAIHNFPPLLVATGKSDQTLYRLQSSTAKPAIASVFRGERKEESESRGEVKAGQEGEEVSHFPSCEAVWEWGPMRVCGVAATFWAERQVRAGGGAKRRLTCLLQEEEKEGDKLN